MLATLAGTTALAGCTRRVRTIAGWESREQVSLRIKTLPDDADPYALRASRLVAEWFSQAGIDATVVPMAEEELYRQVLLNNDFEMFVARLPPTVQNPDTLYSLLHSRYADAPGWQNPFGYADLNVDDMLASQRRVEGDRRREVVAELLRTVATAQPLSVLALPDDIRAARNTNFTGWRRTDLTTSLGYLSLDRVGDGSGDRTADLRTAVTDRRPTENLNPLAVEFRGTGVVMNFLYDSLGHVVEGDIVQPWLAESWRFDDGDAPHARVDLRPDLRWHDGEPLTAGDVAFTYDLLSDTTLGTDEEAAPVPVPRFRGRNSLVDEMRAVDETTLGVQFVECAPRVARRAFTVPVLPRHVWIERTSRVSIGGIEFGPVTEALVTSNVPPVGSGPLRFVRNTPREALVLEPFEEHFLQREGTSDVPAQVAEGPSFDRLVMRVVGSDVAAIETVASGESDVTGTPVDAEAVPRIGRADELDLLVSRSHSPYVLGHNLRESPLTNARFRNTLAQLIDQAHLVDQVFEGYAAPAASPLAGTDWLPDDLHWNDGDPVTPFLGSDGDLDVSRAREAFREAGYEYDGDRIVAGN